MDWHNRNGWGTCVVHMRNAMTGSFVEFSHIANVMWYLDTYAKCYVGYVVIFAGVANVLYAIACCFGAPLAIPKGRKSSRVAIH